MILVTTPKNINPPAVSYGFETKILCETKSCVDRHILANAIPHYLQGPQVNVYLDGFLYEKFTEHHRVTAHSILSSVGGYMGLLLGASLITIFEWMEYLMAISTYWIYRRLRQRAAEHRQEALAKKAKKLNFLSDNTFRYLIQ